MVYGPIAAGVRSITRLPCACRISLCFSMCTSGSGVENDGDLGELRQRDEAFDAPRTDRHTQTCRPFKAIRLTIDPDKGCHFQDARQAHDFDHQIRADIAGTNNRNLDLGTAVDALINVPPCS